MATAANQLKPAVLDGPAFAALMAPLGPFGADRRIAVAVSGGADSMALALLTAQWGQPLALVADHGLRPASAAEARLTIERLTRQGIPSRLLALNVTPGPGLAARARAARYQALIEACAAAGLPQLLLGHHAGDQAETILLRASHGSGPDGRAGMASIQPAGGVALLRPLLGIAPVALRELLRTNGLDWIEDPSNSDLRAERTRLRAMIAEPAGQGLRTAALLAAGRHWRTRRDAAAADTAAWLAGHVTFYPGLHAELPDGVMPASALAALIRIVGSGAYSPPGRAIRRLAAAPVPATLAGARLLRGGGRLHLAREAAAMAPPVPALEGAVWDGRFRLAGGPAAARSAKSGAKSGAKLGALGRDAAGFRRASDLPAAVLATLPCLRAGGMVVSIPHLGLGDPAWLLLPAIDWAATHAARKADGDKMPQGEMSVGDAQSAKSAYVGAQAGMSAPGYRTHQPDVEP